MYQEIKIMLIKIWQADIMENFANKHTEHHGEGVTKAELLTTNFWENKIGWGNDSNSSWEN